MPRCSFDFPWASPVHASFRQLLDGVPRSKRRLHQEFHAGVAVGCQDRKFAAARPIREMDVNAAAYWSERYRRGETGWDLGGETPVLRELLQRGSFPVPAQDAGRKGRILVPGCGYGHDVVLLARRGYDVVAVDFAPEPLGWLGEQLSRKGLAAQLLCVDLFELPQHLSEPVDAVWEYTCYCALDPRRRDEYFAILRQVLRAQGWLVGLFFPLSSEPLGEGPPFPVSREEVLAFGQRHGFVLRQRLVPQSSHPARRGREELFVFQKVS